MHTRRFRPRLLLALAWFVTWQVQAFRLLDEVYFFMLGPEMQAWSSWLLLYASCLSHLSWTREEARYGVRVRGQQRTKMMVKNEFACCGYPTTYCERLIKRSD
jgi:hypothetical protein